MHNSFVKVTSNGFDQTVSIRMFSNSNNHFYDNVIILLYI